MPRNRSPKASAPEHYRAAIALTKGNNDMASRWQVLYQERHEMAKELSGLLDKAEPTAEDVARMDEIEASMNGSQEEYERLERARSTVLSAPKESGLSVPASAPAIVSEMHAREADKPFASLGEQLQAIYRASRPGGSVDPRLFAPQASLGMNETVPADGGFLVQQDLQAGIMKRMYETGQLLSRVRKIPVSANSNGVKLNALAESSRATGSRFGGVTGYWIEEGGTKVASRPAFRQIKLELNKLAALGYATDELMQDAAALDAVMTDAFRDELTFLAENAILNGTGAGQPLGILNSGALISVAAETGQDTATIVYENVVKMWARMYGPSRRSAVWLANADIYPQLAMMSMAVGTGGVPVFMPAGGVSGQPFDTIFGRPILDLEYDPTLGTVGDLMLIDPDQYLWIDKGGIQQATSIHVAFVTDETAFRAVFRCDGAPAWDQPLTPFQGSATRSPFIALATR